MKRSIRAIFFDLDGTLCHLKKPFQEIFTDSFKSIFECKPELTYDIVHKAWRKVLNEEGPMHAMKALTKTLHLLQIGIPLDLEGQIENFRACYQKEIVEKENVKSIMQTLSNFYSLGIITNGPLDLQQDAILKIGVKEWMKAVLISGDPNVGVRKPNAKIFHMGLEMLGSRPEETLMVGDNLEADIHTPQNLGFHVLLLGKMPPPALHAKGGQLVGCIDSLQQLPSLLMS
jgi:putative hydrolase of the HAD superfamily